jgi:hypothetical protein
LVGLSCLAPQWRRVTKQLIPKVASTGAGSAGTLCDFGWFVANPEVIHLDEKSPSRTDGFWGGQLYEMPVTRTSAVPQLCFDLRSSQQIRTPERPTIENLPKLGALPCRCETTSMRERGWV